MGSPLPSSSRRERPSAVVGAVVLLWVLAAINALVTLLLGLAWKDAADPADGRTWVFGLLVVVSAVTTGTYAAAAVLAARGTWTAVVVTGGMVVLAVISTVVNLSVSGAPTGLFGVVLNGVALFLLLRPASAAWLRRGSSSSRVVVPPPAEPAVPPPAEPAVPPPAPPVRDDTPTGPWPPPAAPDDTPTGPWPPPATHPATYPATYPAPGAFPTGTSPTTWPEPARRGQRIPPVVLAAPVAAGVVVLLLVATVLVRAGAGERGSPAPSSPAPPVPTSASAVVGVTEEPTPTPSEVGPEASQSPTEDLDLAVDVSRGDCIAELPKDQSEIFTVRIVDCSTPHEAQVGATFSPDLPTYPSATELNRILNRECPSRINRVLRTDAPAQLVWVGYYPLEEAWTAGDHSFKCLVERKDGKPLSRSVISTA